MSICCFWPFSAGLAFENFTGHCIGILLPRFEVLVLPDFFRALAGLDPGFLVLGVPLARCGNERGVHDLAGHRQIAGFANRPIEPRKQSVKRISRVIATPSSTVRNSVCGRA